MSQEAIRLGLIKNTAPPASERRKAFFEEANRLHVRWDRSLFGPQIRRLGEIIRPSNDRNCPLIIDHNEDKNTWTVMQFATNPVSEETTLNTIRVNPDDSLEIGHEDVTDALQFVKGDYSKFSSERPLDQFNPQAGTDYTFVEIKIDVLQYQLKYRLLRKMYRNIDRTIFPINPIISEIKGFRMICEEYKDAFSGSHHMIAMDTPRQQVLDALVGSELLDGSARSTDDNVHTLIPHNGLLLNEGYRLYLQRGEHILYDLVAG